MMPARIQLVLATFAAPAAALVTGGFTIGP
jgi:hypothetical protein